MFPCRWPLRVFEQTATQFSVVRRALTAPDVTEVICATDAGREGELIFRSIAEAAGCRRPVKRLWISSLTDGAIRAGFAKLRPQADFDGLANAALGRSRADWLVGIEATTPPAPSRARSSAASSSASSTTAPLESLRDGSGAAPAPRPLRALADGEDGPNGLFHPATAMRLPTDGSGGANPFVDVVFEPTP